MAGIRGLNNHHPCPVCLVHKSDQSAYSESWDYRVATRREDLVSIAGDESRSDKDRAEAERELTAAGFRIISVAIIFASPA
jgi:hypothetical protein